MSEAAVVGIFGVGFEAATGSDVAACKPGYLDVGIVVFGRETLFETV